MSKASDIVDVLYHPPTMGELCFRELRLGAGFGSISERRVDLLVLGTAPSGGHKVTAYEVKVSRRDFLADVKNTSKQRGARLFSDRFFYATPPGLVSQEEIPNWAGLVEVTKERSQVIIEAPYLDKERPTWGLIVAMTRNSSGWSKDFRHEVENQKLKNELGGLKFEVDYLKRKRKGE